jgi:hypothetical protein
MVWRPPSTRRNPLHALRRVVEQPGAGPIHGSASTGSVTTLVSPAAAAAPGTAPGTTPFEAPSSLGTRARPAHLAPTTRRHLASEPEPSRRHPDRPARALITSTPTQPERPTAGTAPIPAPITRPPNQPPPSSVWPGAPLTTPTWLRASPRNPIGGATAAATGTSATTTTLLDPDPPRSLPRLPAVNGRKPLGAGQVLVAMLVCLGLWALVDSPALLHNAEAGPAGTRRTAAIDLLKPVNRVAAALSLDRVVRWSDELIGRAPPHQPSTPAPLAVGSSPLTASLPGAAAGAPVASSVTAPHTAVPPAARPGLPPLATPTAAAPLRVLTIGDSIGLSFGQALAAKLDASGLAHTTVDGREGTGLARPDSFDWSAEVQSDLAQFHPQVVVAMFGGNDDQDVIVNNRFIAFGSAQWQQIYAGRVAQIAAEVHAAGARLLWAGLPVMRSASRTARYATVMAVTREALAGREDVVFVDNFATLAGPGGGYVDAMQDPDGQEVLVREPDGIHPSPAGADRLADTAVTEMVAAWHLDLVRGSSPSTTAAPPPTTTAPSPGDRPAG